MRLCRWYVNWVFAVLVAVPQLNTARADIVSALALVESVTADGDGHAELAQAWQVLAEADEQELVYLLESLKNAKPLAANWIVSALDAAHDKLQREGHGMSASELEAWTLEASRGFAARRWALRELTQVAPDQAEQIARSMLHDPVAAFRRPAVEHLITQGVDESLPLADRQPVLQKAFDAARDEDQVRRLAAEMDKVELPADIAEHFGWVMQWHVAGPFDHREGVGFATKYAPESMGMEEFLAPRLLDRPAMEGKERPVQWQLATAGKENGEVDLNKELGPLADVAGYGVAILEADSSQDVELRLRLQNSFKIWLNGKLLLEQPVGHTGNFFDQYTVPATLQPGRNVILVKSLQISPPMPHPFFKTWHFGVRVCDSTGKGLRFQPKSDSQPSSAEKG